MSSVSNILVKIDRFCDYVPFASSITNLVDIFEKCVLLCVSQDRIESNHYFKHIQEKGYIRCIVLVLLPIAGNIGFVIYDFFMKKNGNDAVEKLAGEERVDKFDDFLKAIDKMTKQGLETLCKGFKVDNRKDYIKCMLAFAVKADKFDNGQVDMVFHDAIRYFSPIGELQGFVHEDIAAGRRNEENTLLHEILKCEFLSPKAKGSAFGFILRDGHDYLRDYFGNRSLGPVNQWGNRPTIFEVVRWGNSLKNIYDNLPIQQQKEFFANCNGRAAQRLREFTDIVVPS